MDKKVIKEMLREAGQTKPKHTSTSDVKGVKHADKATKDKSTDNKHEKVSQLLKNDIINHAALIRTLPNEPWVSNSEATNRSLFRKKLNKEKNDDGVEYSFDDETVAEIEKSLMGLSALITKSIGRQGK